MIMKGLVILLGCCLIIQKADCQTLVTCGQWQNCVRPMQGACNAQGQRQVCLVPNLVSPCADTVNIQNFCAIQSGVARDIETLVLPGVTRTTCGMFTGGQMASFAVSDGIPAVVAVAAVAAIPAAIGVPAVPAVAAVAAVAAMGAITDTLVSTITFTGTTVAATCTPLTGVNQCFAAGAAEGSYLLNFATMPCTCTCTPWSAFATCGTNCMRTRTRTCTPPTGSAASSCPQPTTETIGCQGGLCNVCTCQTAPSAWSACTATCGGGTRTRTRTCTRTAGSPTTTVCADMVESEACSTTTCPTGVVATPAPATATCSCTSFSNVGGCSGTCGIGVQTQSSVCSAGCGVNAGQRTVTFSCETGRPCPAVRPAVTATCTCTTFSLRSYSVCNPGTCRIFQFRDCSGTCPTGTTVQLEIPCPDTTTCVQVNPIRPVRPNRPFPVRQRRPRGRRNRNRNPRRRRQRGQGRRRG